MRIGLNPRLGKRERKTVSTSVVQLTVASYTIAASAGATKYGKNDTLPQGAILQLVTDGIYYTTDGSTPSSTVGFSASAGDYIELDTFQKIKEFRAIRSSGSTDAAIEAQYLYGS